MRIELNHAEDFGTLHQTLNNPTFQRLVYNVIANKQPREDADLWFFEDSKIAETFYAKWPVRNLGQKHEFQYFEEYSL